MNELETMVAWTNLPVPEVLGELSSVQQDQVLSWAKSVVSLKTEGFDELYQAISMIVKYIPHFVVIPLMVEHIRPQIAAGVCKKMNIDQATHYANDLPFDYFTEVAIYMESELMARILEKMKRHAAEKFIRSELERHLPNMLDIASHLNEKMLKTIASLVRLPDDEEEFANSPHKAVIEKIRALQK